MRVEITFDDGTTAVFEGPQARERARAALGPSESLRTPEPLPTAPVTPWPWPPVLHEPFTIRGPGPVTTFAAGAN